MKEHLQSILDTKKSEIEEAMEGYKQEQEWLKEEISPKVDENKDMTSNNDKKLEIDPLNLYKQTKNREEVEVWVAPKIPQELREKRLFPEWIPTNEAEMKKYLTRIEVPIIPVGWKTSVMLRVHKKLAQEIKSAFQELKKKWMRVDPNHIWCYKWREKRNKPNEMSIHSYWWAIDINYTVNKWDYGTPEENKRNESSPYHITPEFANIWKKHWFYRWQDRTNAKKDPMHFSYTEKPDPIALT